MAQRHNRFQYLCDQASATPDALTKQLGVALYNTAMQLAQAEEEIASNRKKIDDLIASQRVASAPRDLPREEAISPSARPRLFILLRDADATGTSGTGHVADGVEFPDGTVALRWRTVTSSSAFYASLADVEAIHGHGGSTRIVFEQGSRFCTRCLAARPNERNASNGCAVCGTAGAEIVVTPWGVDEIRKHVEEAKKDIDPPSMDRPVSKFPWRVARDILDVPIGTKVVPVRSNKANFHWHDFVVNHRDANWHRLGTVIKFAGEGLASHVGGSVLVLFENGDNARYARYEPCELLIPIDSMPSERAGEKVALVMPDGDKITDDEAAMILFFGRGKYVDVPLHRSREVSESLTNRGYLETRRFTLTNKGKSAMEKLEEMDALEAKKDFEDKAAASSEQKPGDGERIIEVKQVINEAQIAYLRMLAGGPYAKGPPNFEIDQLRDGGFVSFEPSVVADVCFRKVITQKGLDLLKSIDEMESKEACAKNGEKKKIPGPGSKVRVTKGHLKGHVGTVGECDVSDEGHISLRVVLEGTKVGCWFTPGELSLVTPDQAAEVEASKACEENTRKSYEDGHQAGIAAGQAQEYNRIAVLLRSFCRDVLGPEVQVASDAGHTFCLGVLQAELEKLRAQVAAGTKPDESDEKSKEMVEIERLIEIVLDYTNESPSLVKRDALMQKNDLVALDEDDVASVCEEDIVVPWVASINAYSGCGKTPAEALKNLMLNIIEQEKKQHKRVLRALEGAS